MKIKAVILFFILLCFGRIFMASAQSPMLRSSIDTDIRQLRNNAIPNFDYNYDDYLQYLPAATMVGMKAFGYESRSSWGRMAVSDMFSVAIMNVGVRTVKPLAGRLRPDGSDHRSFPSGHTATAFMTAAMLDHEYGWRSPWFSIAGYTTAAITGVSRICNNRHWLSDVVTGAGIGIGSVYLGYFLADLIFKEKGICDGYVKPEFTYDASQKHYVAEMVFGRRLIIGPDTWKENGSIPTRSSMAGISTDIPIIPGIGITGLASASSLTYAGGGSTSLYSTMAGGYYNIHFAKILELQTKVMAGYAWETDRRSGLSLGAGASLSLITGNNFKIKGFAEWESMNLKQEKPWLNTLVVGFGTGWFW